MKNISFKRLFYFSTFILFFAINPAKASHVVGYDMTLINIKDASGNGTNNYKLRVKFFRDVTGIGIPTTFNFNLRANGGAQPSIRTVTVTKINPQTFLTYPPEECPPAQAQLKVEYGLYESAPFDASTYSNAAGYYFVCVENARNPGIINVLGASDDYSILMTMELPRLDNASIYKHNSSPEFKKNPLTFFCVGKPYTLNWQIEDPDGDSLVFSLSQPIDNGTVKPFALIPYAAGYNLYYNILDGVPDLTINPKTGIINFIPTRTGKYLVGFKVEEYRNGVKIGEIRREYQLETVLCPEAPPVTEDNNNQKRNITDTIDFGEEFRVKFISRDSPSDRLFMKIVPDITPGENILDPNTYQAKWGEVGQPLGDPAAGNLVIEGVGQVEGEFIWKPRCDHVREKPYTFTVVVHDETCPSPFYDSTYVTLYVQKKPNIDPFFVLPDTIASKNTDETILQYFVNAGEMFRLEGDSIIKTYDRDSSQVVNITINPDPANDTINKYFIFSPNNTTVNSTAIFRLQTTCEFQRDEPYRWEFIATDNDCKSPSFAKFTILLYIKDQPNLKPVYDASLPTTFSVPEGTTQGFDIVIRDVYNAVNNKFNTIKLSPDLSDFAAVNGGAMPNLNLSTSNDSLRVSFTWTPVCANVRLEPYRLKLYATDGGCPIITASAEVLVYATGPYNSAPEFRDIADNKFNKIDTAIYAGEEFIYNLYAVDTNQRFDSVFISLDQNSEISNANIVEYTAELIPASGKDSARTVLRWRSDCFDIRSTPYKAYIIASDNECVNPERDTLLINITVLERPNFVPKFTPSTISSLNNIYQLPATSVLEIPFSAFDTLTGEIIMLDTVYTNIPVGKPKPEIARKSGLGVDTVSNVLRWELDCSLIRNEPYIIKIAAWDEACRNPQDSARFTFQVLVEKNPLLNPVFNIAKDTLIEVVAGENFELELIATSINPGDSVKINYSGTVFGGIPGEVASFEQTQVQGQGKGLFKWTTGCDQISETIYTANFITANYPCQSDEDTLKVQFKVVPNTDVTNEIPNVFTPNGDAINDTYSIIKQYKVYCDPGFKFSIFNRWGKKVFESVDPAFVWDPKETQPAGTYFYTLESRARKQTGTIEIVK